MESGGPDVAEAFPYLPRVWRHAAPRGHTWSQRFTTRFCEKRYSFGYPARPNLEEQVGILRLLWTEEIGVQLTEGLMQDPEASVSALVSQHTDCSYLHVGETGKGVSRRPMLPSCQAGMERMEFLICVRESIV
jgi:Vitamin B12 dependent methionine synthase, activation domain